MLQYIILAGYVGSNSSYVFDQDCDGELLSQEEAIELGLTSRGALRRHRKSDYQYAWYRIVSGNKITITIKHYRKEPIDRVFTIPEAGLPEPPVSLDDDRLFGMYEYLSKHCMSKDIECDDGDKEKEDQG